MKVKKIDDYKGSIYVRNKNNEWTQSQWIAVSNFVNIRWLVIKKKLFFFYLLTQRNKIDFLGRSTTLQHFFIDIVRFWHLCTFLPNIRSHFTPNNAKCKSFCDFILCCVVFGYAKKIFKLIFLDYCINSNFKFDLLHIFAFSSLNQCWIVH